MDDPLQALPAEAPAATTGGPAWYFEDFEPGAEVVTMSRSVRESDLSSFVGLAGFFEQLFLDDTAAAANQVLPTRFVPGQLTFILAEGLYLLTGQMRHGVALLGFEKMSFVKPVFVGATVRAVVTIEATRPTRRPDMGMITARHNVLIDEGVLVLSYESRRMVARRERPQR